MRCKACNIALSDGESLAKDGEGRHYDLCSTCLAWHLDSLAELVEEGMSFIDPEAEQPPEHERYIEGDYYETYDV